MPHCQHGGGTPHRNKVRLSQQDAGGALPAKIGSAAFGAAALCGIAGRTARAAAAQHEIPPGALCELGQARAGGMEGEQPHICSSIALSAGSCPEASPHGTNGILLQWEALCDNGLMLAPSCL